MKFAEFHVGQTIVAGSYLVSEKEMVGFSEAYDPQWFHVDAKAAKKGPFGRLIASGWHTCAIAMRLAVDVVLQDSESFASPGVSNISWKNPVRPGDRLTFKATVLERRRTRKNPDRGLLRWRWQLFDEDGREVLDLEATSLFDLTKK